MDIGQHWQEICHAIQEGVFLVNPQGRIVMANEAMTRLTGYTAQELMGKSCRIIGCNSCELERIGSPGPWCNLFAGQARGAKRCILRRKDGSEIAVFKNQSLIRDPSGVVLGAVESVLDLTEIDRLDRKVVELSRLLDHPSAFYGMVGKAPVMRRLYDILEKAAQSDAPVLLLGESGTGKELAAHAIHAMGPRKTGPFVGLNCAALNESLLESELFGHAKGAFTGAVRQRQGRFEAANGGDIFLDEIGDTPLSIQVKLLRVLETKTMERVGEVRPIKVDARLITATNRNLNQLIAQGRFREDFYFRINVIPIVLPPLREHPEDIPLLVDHFLHLLSAKTGKPVNGVSPKAMEVFMSHPWPGNVRELRSAMEYAFVLAPGGAIEPGHLPPGLAAAGCAPGSMTAWTDGASPSHTIRPAQSDTNGNTVSNTKEHTDSYTGGFTGVYAGDHALGGASMQAPGHMGVRAQGRPGGFEPDAQQTVPVNGQSPPSAVTAPAAPQDEAPPADQRQALVDALRRSGGNKSQAARILGINRVTVLNRMRKYNIRYEQVLMG